MFTFLMLAALAGGGFGMYKWHQKEKAKQAALDEELKKMEEEVIENPIKPSAFDTGNYTPRKNVDPNPWKRPPPAYVPPVSTKKEEPKKTETRSDSSSGVGDFVTGAVVGAVINSWLSSDSSSSSSSSSSYSDSGWSSGGDSGGGGSSSDF